MRPALQIPAKIATNFEGARPHRMNRTLIFTLAAGLSTLSLSAQTAAPAAPAAAPVAAPPQALPAKVAIIAFEQVVVATNEGQRSVQDIQKKYEPQKAKIDTLAAEVDSLKKQIQALPANAPDDQRSSLIRNEDAKEKQLNLDAESASNSYNADLQDAYSKVAQKVGSVMVKYVSDMGFTLLLNAGGGQQTPNPVLWWNPATDISQAVVNAYNTSSGVAAPPPSAPSASRPRASTTPRPAGAATTPKK